ncbi:helix-turn-helix domain-containing protein [Clostridium sp. 19966]|uniref:helix-turn-helix domain-containing protein n=1 Tax=Clostridium sp. 19966 TaxID=2768166 RepID=UPI0028DEFF6F|nr:helix-turn-helix domain-containing protein [Clostridium sp. 19966]MDT8717512.1 helix-turn-helix domain-containing protein [Clostridium sp. 19966]
MNYYERIQKSIDYMEENLEQEMTLDRAAREAFMSLSNFHRMFFTLVGYSAKEYIRNRRISTAAGSIKKEKTKIIDIAAKYDYDSADAFSRTFKNITGVLPSKYNSSKINFTFERINLMDKYFHSEDRILAESYPDIKVLKNLPTQRVAYYRYFGTRPEQHAFSVMGEWIRKNKIDICKGEYRIFGYNSPEVSPDAKEYGYELCLTIPKHMEVEDEKIKTKTLMGGMYAVTGIERGQNLGENIIKGWQRFNSWLEGSKYVYGGYQWLEEHLSFDEKGEHIGGVDLYMPIKER